MRYFVDIMGNIITESSPFFYTDNPEENDSSAEDLIEVDNIIAPVISTLVKKGYHIKYAFSASPNFGVNVKIGGRDTIVSYNDIIKGKSLELYAGFYPIVAYSCIEFSKIYEFQSLPKGWDILYRTDNIPVTILSYAEMYTNRDYCTGMISVNSFSYFDILQNIIDHVKLLYDWVLDLPSLIKQ